ncbi:MAG: isocitrate/isopropylmalate family dehydrogenase [Candidatus Woesearchaeota archaeon]
MSVQPSHSVALIPGDLNGKTVTDAVVELSHAVHCAGILSLPISHTTLPYNAEYFVNEGIKELRKSELGTLLGFDAIFEGAIGDPTKLKPGVIEVGLLLKIRQEFDQYVNLRPVVLAEGVDSPLRYKDHRHINFEIVRENTEGLYVGKGRIANPGTDAEVAIQEMQCSYKGVKRLIEYAVERAIVKGEEKGRKPRLHIAFKNNVLTYACSPWDRVLKEFKEARDDVDIGYIHIDNFGMQMITCPEQFDVVATENMFGDIMTDIGAILGGGIGAGVSGNIDPTRRFPSMFEPLHGSAPDKWYETLSSGEYVKDSFVPELVQKVKPEAAFMSYAMMLEHLGEPVAAKVMKDAALANLRNPNYKTMTLNHLVDDACKYVQKQV